MHNNFYALYFFCLSLFINFSFLRKNKDKVYSAAFCINFSISKVQISYLSEIIFMWHITDVLQQPSESLLKNSDSKVSFSINNVEKSRETRDKQCAYRLQYVHTSPAMKAKMHIKWFTGSHSQHKLVNSLPEKNCNSSHLNVGRHKIHFRNKRCSSKEWRMS